MQHFSLSLSCVWGFGSFWFCIVSLFAAFFCCSILLLFCVSLVRHRLSDLTPRADKYLCDKYWSIWTEAVCRPALWGQGTFTGSLTDSAALSPPVGDGRHRRSAPVAFLPILVFPCQLCGMCDAHCAAPPSEGPACSPQQRLQSPHRDHSSALSHRLLPLLLRPLLLLLSRWVPS